MATEEEIPTTALPLYYVVAAVKIMLPELWRRLATRVSDGR